MTQRISLAGPASGLAVGVVGAGTMGSGIAQVALEAGHPVAILDPAPGAVEHAWDAIADGLARRARRRSEDPEARATWVAERIAHLSVATDLGTLARGRHLIIEAVIEDLTAKRAVFEALDRAAPADAVLATNTSALSVAGIAAATSRPERVCGLHFFSPVPLMRLVEVGVATTTDRDTARSLASLMTRWGKAPITCADVPGFVVNRVNRPFTLEALAMVEAGSASLDDIDAAVRLAGYPMGPFELIDMIGLDVNLATTRSIHAAAAAQGDPLAERFRPSMLQERLVAAGRLGRKTGAGFHTYPAGAHDPSGIRTGSGSAEPDIADRIRLAILLEAYRALDAGIATEDAIDRGLREGAGHPMGPFEWTQRMGGRSVVEVLVRERGYAGPRFALGAAV